jgi:Zn-dependent M28 family amino/carboxypeptidase
MRSASIVAIAALAAPALCGGGKPGHNPPPGHHTPPGPGYGNKKLVTSKALQKLVTLDNLLAGSQVLQDIADANGGNRAFGGAGHNATTEYIYQELLKTGYYDVYKQPFVELFSAATVKLTVGGEDLKAEFMTYGPSGDVSAPVVEVADIGCNDADYPATVSGNIAIIKRGTCPFQEKALKAKAAGAVGAIIYNHLPGALAGTLGAVGDYAPTVGVTNDVGLSILAKVAAGETVADLFVDTIQENRTNYNVIAETKGGDHNNVLMLGGHTDSVFAGPGINDDGSGSIGSLVVAKALTNFKIKNAVRFGFWGAEEFGKLGSFYYLKTINGTFSGTPAEAHKVRAYLNFDMIASPNYILGVYDGDGSAFNFSGPAGSDTIEKDFEEFYTSQGKPFVPSVFTGRSDYAAFLENGIPSGGLFTGAEELKTEEEAQLFGGEAGVALDVNYHQPGDTIDNLAHDAYLLNTKSIANSVAKYATSWAGIPEANLTVRKRSADLHRFNARFDDHAHAHSHAAPCGAGHIAI